MATSPTSKSAPLSGAAKDDTLAAGVTFTIADLLANDPGGAAKINTSTQFFFGTAADQYNQAAYMAAHGIIDNGNGTYTLTSGATDFQYMVQIGNKGTWSLADVDVLPPPPPKGQLGGNLFTENFDGYADSVANPQFAVVDLNNASGWVGAQNSELGANGYGGIANTSPGATDLYWLDTQNSPGGISISHEFTDSTAPVNGTTAVLSFDIAKQALNYNGTDYATDPDALFQFKIDGAVVKEIHASDLAVADQMYHYDIQIGSYANSGNTHVLELVDATVNGAYTGFAVDSIKINDWVV